MSRRHSRVSLADRQNEALQEFESLKRKYLQYNKQIIKENSQLRVTVEELKSQLSQLYADNLNLSRSNIALEKQLKRERAVNKKRGGNGNAIQQADAAAVSMIQELERLRRAIGQMVVPLSPSPPRPQRELTVRERPDPANRVNLISKAPDFDLIQEGDSEDDEEQHGNPDPRFVPLPDDDPPRAPSPPSPFVNAIATSSTIATTTCRKPTRRQSGLIGPVRSRAMSPGEEPASQEEDEVDDMLVDDVSNTSSTTTTTKIRLHATADEPTTKTKRKGKESKVAHKLKDVTNSPPRPNDASEASRKGIMSILSENSEDERLALPKPTKQEPKARKSHSKQPPPSAAPPPEPSVQVLEIDMTLQPRRSSAQAASGEDVDTNGTGARPARARKSVNYAEPKLNTKMRKPDDAAPVAYTYPALPMLDPSGGPSQQPSGANIPSGRPIKPLVLPSSLKKASKKTSPQDHPKSSKLVVDEPRPPEAGSSLSMKDRSKAKVNPFSDRSPSPSEAIEVSDGGEEDDRQTDDDEESEEDTENDGSDCSTPSPRKPSRRSTTTAFEEFKCASLTSKISIAKPSSRGSASTATSTDPSAPAPSKANSLLTAPLSSTASHTLLFPRKPFVPTSSSGTSSSIAASSASVALNSRKRKAPPTKYVYLDLSDDDDVVQASAGDEQEEEYLPKERRKTINGVAGGATKLGAARPGAEVTGKDRRLSSAT
ncbi:hypothetical protein FRB96_005228 [Tulasnella sp. 330]|nr:hypothetical protein FRB96_005228 [Tulasnella sp. 330]